MSPAGGMGDTGSIDPEGRINRQTTKIRDHVYLQKEVEFRQPTLRTLSRDRSGQARITTEQLL